MEDQLRQLNLPYRRVDAVDGRQLDMSNVGTFAIPERVEEWKHLLTPNAIACSMSHRKAYAAALADGVDAALILEDDITLLPSFAAVLKQAIQKVGALDVCLLYFHGDEKTFVRTQSTDLIPGFCIYKAKTSWGAYAAGAYLIRQDVIARLHAHVFPVHTTADSWGTFRRDGVIDGLCAVLPLTTTDAPFTSDIGYGRFPSLKSVLTKSAFGRLLISLVRKHFKPVPHGYRITDEQPEPI